MKILGLLLVTVIIGFFIYSISGRLMGTRINFVKRFLAVVISMILTTVVYWYSYLRTTDFLTNDFYEIVTDPSAIIWTGSMLLIAMLLYLFFELFDPRALTERGKPSSHKSFFTRLFVYRRRQKRFRAVLQIAMTNGFTRTLQYARHRENEEELARAFRDTLEQAGGIFVKFGQVLSTRSELFPRAFIRELSNLQQHVTPLSNDQVIKLLDEALPGKIEDVFSDFDYTPLAAASIGQVHKARLKESNELVVVKLLRPDVSKIMEDDLGILLDFAEWISERSSWAESIGFQDLARGFAEGLKEEIDFSIEVRNTLQIAKTVNNSVYPVKVPFVYTRFSNNKMIVQEYVEGCTIVEADELIIKHDLDRYELAQTVLYSFFEQMIGPGIFHADPHPGNIFIDGKTGEATLLDFGAVGRLPNEQQEAFHLFLLGLHQQNESVLVDALTKMISESAHIDRIALEQEVGQLLLKVSYVTKIPTQELVFSLFAIVRKHGLHFYPSVAQALRSLVTLDGTLSIIHPSFDTFAEAKEFSEEYIHEMWKKPFQEPKELWKSFEEEMALALPALRKLPRRVDQLIKRVESGKIILHHDIFSDKANNQFVTLLFSKFVLLMVGITFGIISVALLAIAQVVETAYAVYLNTVSYVGLFLCAILLVRLSVQAIRDIKKL
ncbi:AarF/UbiB family protein [Chryseomicrobium sp. FSL W7-1435]|uniref:ABC1 kinase family protein n=1 Tax=Chryseomicrobium sp. FSL W7-1435 TaxID=2921704 RepID=UPI00315AE1CC